jgi:hypothetical protein
MKTETGSTQLALWTEAELKELAGGAGGGLFADIAERVLVRVPETLASKQEAAPAGT